MFISEGLLRSTCSIGMAFDPTIHIVDDDRAILIFIDPAVDGGGPESSDV